MDNPRPLMKRKVPQRIEECFSDTANSEFHCDVTSFHQKDYETLDFVINAVQKPFGKRDYETCCSSKLTDKSCK